jgi:tRNA pseudouridine38-40 synthase
MHSSSSKHPSRNLKVVLSFNGKDFHGTQTQKHSSPTVLDTFKKAWEILTSGEIIEPCGCSRLDAGVHALGYIVNFKTQTSLGLERIFASLNGIFRSLFKVTLIIYRIEETHEEFHARYDALYKYYRYEIWTGSHVLHHLVGRVWEQRGYQEIWNQPDSLEKLRNILHKYQGDHNFSAFRAKDCNAFNPFKTIDQIFLTEDPEYPEHKIIHIYGKSFLKQMIRNMVGTAVDIFLGKLPENTLEQAFIHGDRTKTGTCAPGKGLTLVKVGY